MQPAAVQTDRNNDIATAVVATMRQLGAQIRDARDGAERMRKIILGLRSFSRSHPTLEDVFLKLTGRHLRE